MEAFDPTAGLHPLGPKVCFTKMERYKLNTEKLCLFLKQVINSRREQKFPASFIRFTVFITLFSVKLKKSDRKKLLQGFSLTLNRCCEKIKAPDDFRADF